MQNETTTLVSTPVKLSFLRLPSIFRRSKSTPEAVLKKPPSFQEEKNTTTIKDVFPVTRYATTHHTLKKQHVKKESSIQETTTTTVTTVPKRRSPRKKKIDTSFRGLLRNDNQSNSWTEDKVYLEHNSPTRTTTVEEGVATAAAAKLLLEASQRMQDQETVDSGWTSHTCCVTDSLSNTNNPSEPLLSNTKCEKTGSSRVVSATDTVEYIHQILKREEDICRWQQVMLNFLVSKTNTTKAETLDLTDENDEQQQEPWEQLLQEQKRQLSIVKELIEMANLELPTTDGVVDSKNSENLE
ncbi:hypothetical protein GpartN1_g3177.t1 [Galdieria partita]|uniref:Uncharacterized protein n=1 Tax=Galdieria partita TaxID=83374 RepID=A0A9C7PX21_9RHOD|nr:hypothetical protein GpartN1_g3177.t1 [Galdieria partita]